MALNQKLTCFQVSILSHYTITNPDYAGTIPLGSYRVDD